MTQEHFVSVELKPPKDAETQAGEVNFCAGERLALKLKPGQVAAFWESGQKITRGEFERVLEPEGLFQISTAAGSKVKDKGKE